MSCKWPMVQWLQITFMPQLLPGLAIISVQNLYKIKIFVFEIVGKGALFGYENRFKIIVAENSGRIVVQVADEVVRIFAEQEGKLLRYFKTFVSKVRRNTLVLSEIRVFNTLAIIIPLVGIKRGGVIDREIL